jgi:hypothetical protein
MCFSVNLLSAPLVFKLFVKKVKVKLYLCLTKHPAMKTYWGIGGINPLIL